MSGLKILTEEQRREMLHDARDAARRAAFAAAQRLSQEGSIDDYIDFLSENMDLVGPSQLRVHVTVNFRL
jgi:biotin synthase-related radical SAM superfamily protein